MKELLLWLWPKIRWIYGRYGVDVELGTARSVSTPSTPTRVKPQASGAHATHVSRSWVPGAHVWLLVAALWAAPAHAAPDNLRAVRNAFSGYRNPFRLGESLEPQGGGVQSGPSFRFDGSYNLLVDCITGCSASSGFTDNSAFSVGSSTINPIGALYTASTPSISSGNAGRVRMDSNSYLLVDCITGCSASGGFADNSGFTAGTTAIGISGGWYSTSPTNCTSGNACAPQLTQDRKLFVQAFQGTSPWVVSANGGTFAVTQSGTWNVGLNSGSNTIGKADILGNAGGTLDSSGQNQAGVNWLTAGCNFFTSPTTINNTQGSPLGCDNADNLLVHVNVALPTGSNVIGGVTGSGNFTVVQGTGTNLHMVCDSGCSSSSGFTDNSAFTVGTTAINPIGGYYISGADPSISSGNAGRARIDSHSYLGFDLFNVAGSAIGATNPLFSEITDGTNAIGAMANFGNAPSAVKSLNVNASDFCGTAACDYNTGNASGQTPRQVIATNNPAIANWGQGATGSAVPSGAVYAGGNGSGNLTGQIMCDSTVIKNNFSTSGSTQIVATPGPGKNTYICGFTVNGASTTANTVKLVYGTHTTTDCDTGANDLSVAVPIQAPTSIAPAGQNVSPPSNVVWKTGATNNQVCVNLSAAQAVNLQVWYTSF